MPRKKSAKRRAEEAAADGPVILPDLEASEGSEVETTAGESEQAESTESSKTFRSGFVSILGRPNAGKSTLLNALLGTKVSIVADKPQTTRTTVQAVWNTPRGQVVFLDTPGIHKSDTLFNKRMMHAVRMALDERDLLLFVADATYEFSTEDSQALDLVRKAETPVWLLMNKVDRVSDKQQLLPRIEAYTKAFEFEQVFPISARQGEGLDKLKQALLERMPEGPQYFPPDFLTDQPERFLSGELIREKILLETRQEVPHSVAVLVEAFEEKKTLTRIAATIYVERDGQKAIIIGSKGSMLKAIGTAARLELEELLGRKVHLELFVKVRNNWRESPEFLNELDWRTVLENQAE
jgi:GTPase